MTPANTGSDRRKSRTSTRLLTRVVRARTVRLTFAWVVLVLILIAELVGLASVDDLGQAALVALSLATTAQLVAMGVLVGVLGGLIGPVDDGLDVRLSDADARPLRAPLP